jgi:hypothetical protein
VILNRTAAIDFARSHWDTVADDGVFWLSSEAVSVEAKRVQLGAALRDGWDFKFVTYLDAGKLAEKAVFAKGSAEKLVQDWAGLADCAHFLSRILRAGGITGAESLSVPRLVEILQQRADTRTLAERVNRSQGQNIVDSGVLKPGDVIAYFNIAADGDYGGSRSYSHSAIYVGKVGRTGTIPTGRITCHTISRFGGLTSPLVSDEWHLGSSHYAYTFIHFSDDDSAPALLVKAAPLFVGWWEVSVPAGKPVFQLNDSTGRSYFTTTRPKSSRTGPSGDRAYWFATSLTAPVSISVTWRGDATVDVWTAGSDPREFVVVTNGGPPRTATRMF